MLLEITEALSFMEVYESVLLHVFELTGKKRTKSKIHDLVTARDYLVENPAALALAIETVKSKLNNFDEELEKAIISLKVGKWVHLRHTTRYALLLDEKIEHAYAVKALTDPLHEIVGGKAFIFETGICRYKSHYICDGIVRGPVFLGPDYKAELNQAYKEIKKNGRFHIHASEDGL